MAAHIAIIQGHPDSRAGASGARLRGAYAAGVDRRGRKVETDRRGEARFRACDTGGMGIDRRPTIRKAQENIARAEHLLILYPLGLAHARAVKGFSRGAAAWLCFQRGPGGSQWKKMLAASRRASW